jgi:hypothetical protein
VLQEAHDTSIVRLISEPNWYQQLATTLRDSRPDLLAKWNYTRTSRATEIVEQWCAQNNVSHATVFINGKKKTDSPTAAATPHTKDVRGQILSALARMSTDQLLELSIPAKYLLTEPSGK